ncbi:uncharacterized protein [Aegilops tauschii subsp. strangulata]|uniref:uncharacterized protein n=1 Tax=Aegilops tauschii subsp. strangulata TaxID=200361 RepID=UPI003CC86C14
MTLHDATELVQSCEACQFHAKKVHHPAQCLHTIPLSWPFAVWGLDILGPFPRNGQAEHANVEVLRGLKTRSFKRKLEACGRGWLGELQSVFWCIRTTTTKSTCETPIFLVYGAEAVLPHEVKHCSMRVLAFNEARQDASRGTDLMLGEEARRQASLPVARYQQALRRYHYRSVHSRTLELGELVLRRVLSWEGFHKLLPMWEGLFRVARVSRPGAVHLDTQDEVPIQNA